MIRHIDIIVEPNPQMKKAKRFRARAPKGSHFTDKGIDEVLEGFADKFDDANPNHKYRLVPLSKHGGTVKFKLVWSSDEGGTSPATSEQDSGAVGVDRQELHHAEADPAGSGEAGDGHHGDREVPPPPDGH